MKKLLLLLSLLAIMGCGGERDNQVGVGISDKVYTVIVDGHKYVIFEGYCKGGIVHAESCPCKGGK